MMMPSARFPDLEGATRRLLALGGPPAGRVSRMLAAQTPIVAGGGL